MEDGHERVEHLRADVVVDILVVLVAHVLRRAAGDVVVEDIFSEQADLFLVAYSVSIVNILALLVLVEAFALLGSGLP
jgi:hypothetical protein